MVSSVGGGQASAGNSLPSKSAHDLEVDGENLNAAGSPSGKPETVGAGGVEQLNVSDAKRVVKRNVVSEYFHKKAEKYADNATSFGREVAGMCRQTDCRGTVRRMCTVDNLRTKIYISRWLPTYSLEQFQGDLIAGITVGLTVIPQSLAYAKIAELPPQYGLYSAFIGCFVYMLLGTSRDVTYGPTAVMSLLTAEFGHHPHNHDDARLAILLAFINGIVQIVMAVANIGIVVDYISHPVINSFTTAAGITIACSQLKKWLGLKKIRREFISQLIDICRKIHQTRIYDFLLGSFCMTALYLMKRMKDAKFAKSPSSTKGMKVVKYLIWLSSTARNAIVVLLSTGLSALLFHQDIAPFSLTGNIVGGIPTVAAPQFSWTWDDDNTTTAVATVEENFKIMGIGVIVVPILGVIETIAIGKAFGRKNNYNVIPNQELLAIGFSNFIGSFFSAYPITASFSRSAVNAQSGVKTPGGSLYTGVLVLLALAFLTPLFFYIPDAALAAVIIMAVIDIIDFTMIPHLWRVRKLDLLPWFTAFFVSLIFGFEYGIILGVAVSLLILLYPWSRPKIQVEPVEAPSSTKILIFSVDMGLAFAGIEHLEDKIYNAAFKETEPYSVVLNLQQVSDVDYTAVQGVEQLQAYFTKKKAQLVLCNLNPHVRQIFDRAALKNVRFADSVDEATALIRQGALLTDDENKRQAVRAAGEDVLLTQRDDVIHSQSDEPEPNCAIDVRGATDRQTASSPDGVAATEVTSKLASDGSIIVEVSPPPYEL